MNIHSAKRVSLVLLMMAATLAGSGAAHAASAPGTGVQGTMTLNFTEHVTWHTSAQDTTEAPQAFRRRSGTMAVRFNPSRAARQTTLAALRAQGTGPWGAGASMVSQPTTIQAARVTSLNVTETATADCAPWGQPPLLREHTTLANTIVDGRVAYQFTEVKLNLRTGRGELVMGQAALPGLYAQQDAAAYPCVEDPRPNWDETHGGAAPIYAGSNQQEPLSETAHDWLDTADWKLRRVKGRWRVLMNHPARTYTQDDGRSVNTIRATSNLYLKGTPKQLQAWCKIPENRFGQIPARTHRQAHALLRKAGIQARLADKTVWQQGRTGFVLQGRSRRTGPINANGNYAWCNRGSYRVVKYTAVRP